MIKKINILVLVLVIFLSVGVVSASDDLNMADSDTSSDILEISENNNAYSISQDSVISSSHTISQGDSKYFSDGNFVEESINSGDTIYLDGSFSNSKFTFTKPVNIVGTSSNNMKNSVITLLSGASGSSISNLKIANTNNQTYGIFLNSASYCSIKDCNIVNTGMSSYCICVANGANYNNVTDNYLKAYGITYGHGSNSRSTPPLLLSSSHNNYVANNHVEADDANGIYLSSYSGGPLTGGVSNFNVIYNNTVHYNVLPTSWAYGIQIMGNNNTIKSNTVIGGYRGVSTSGYYNSIIGNSIINITGADYNNPGIETGGEYGIVASYNSYVADNIVSGAKIISTGAGMSAIDNSVLENNWVNVTLKEGRGIVAGGSNVIIKNNVVYTESGSGIYEKDEGYGLLVSGNNITSVYGVGILIEKLSSTRMPKDVIIINNTISTKNKYAIDASGALANSSEIDNNNVSGLINSPSGVIDPSKPTYIYKGKTHYITPDNIRDYINYNGGLTSEISDKDILSFSGTFSNEVIYITKGVKITGNNPIFYNSTFKVTSGNVLIENLTIINKNAERVNAWGIFVNQAPGVRIINNHITVNDPKASYAVYVLESTDIEVLNNDLTSEGDYLTFTLLSYASEDCIFANNTIKTTGTGNAYQFSPEKCIDGNELVINGRSYCLDGAEVVIDGTSYCIDGNELYIDGTSYCLDGNEFVIDGTSYCLDGNELSINGTTYTLNNNEIILNGVSYCLDGEEVVIDGTSYCLDGNELVINGTSYCLDGSESSNGGFHIVSEIYQTYGMLLLYSSNNLVSGNNVTVTSKLQNTYSAIGNGSSQNSLVGIDLYFNCHNNSVSQNNIFVKGNDNYIYGAGVLGYYTGHSAPKGQGATNNSFKSNTITLEGLYCVEGIIIGDECEDTIIEDNIINVKSDAVGYGIYFEMPHSSDVTNNSITLNSQVAYGILGYDSDNNNVISNDIVANAYYAYGVLFSNGNNNLISKNKIYANGTGKKITFLLLDSIGYGNAGICFKSNSTNNVVKDNEITSVKDFAVLIGDEAINNVISDNYLVSEKGIANSAINESKNNTISGNYRYVANPTVNNITVLYLGSGEFTVKFENDLNGASVNFYDADNKLFATSTVSNGIASAVYKFDQSYIPAQYIFSARISKENYKSSSFDIGVLLTKGNIVINLSQASIEQTAKGNIVATVSDEFGNPIEGALIEFKRINSQGRATAIGSAKTNGSGVASIEYTVTSALSVGEHNIVAEANDVTNYNNANASSKLIVSEKISISGAKNYAVYYGNTVTYKVRIIDVNTKSPVQGKLVTFKINGKTKTVPTNANGYASYSVKLKAGSYGISIACNGHSVSKKITFKPTLTAKNMSKKKAKTTKFTVKLVNKNGKILKNKKIVFKFKNKKYTAKTNKKGIATLSLKNLKVGKYAITSSYGGCTIKNTITIKK